MRQENEMSQNKIHKKHIVPMDAYPLEYDSDEDCDGTLTYDEVLEGKVCNKCNYYDGVK